MVETVRHDAPYFTDRTKDTSFFDQCHVRCWFRDSVVLELHGSTFRESSAFVNQSLHKIGRDLHIVNQPLVRP